MADSATGGATDGAGAGDHGALDSSCPTGLIRCGDACVDRLTSLAHCGECDRPCPTETTDRCVEGRCVCGATGGTCVKSRCQGGACCGGCWDGTTCQPGKSADHCGKEGGACGTCVAPSSCHVASCATGVCLTGALIEGAPCPGGLCRGGACCTGCYDGATCQGGSASTGCGSGGYRCVDCTQGGGTCAAGSCAGWSCGAGAKPLHYDWPVPIIHSVCQHFNNPITYQTCGFNTGIDVCGPFGLALVAIAAGKVVHVGPMWYDAEGKGRGPYAVILQHAPNFYSTYGHNQSVAVKVGDCVMPGQLVGEMGSLGYSAGPHLHFEMLAGTPFTGSWSVPFANACQYYVDPLLYVTP